MKKKLFCPNCNRELIDGITEAELPKIKKACKEWKKWMGTE